MSEVLIDNIFVMFGWGFFLQKGDILIGINCTCVRVLTDLFAYSYKADFMHRVLKKNEKKLTRSFNFTFRNIDDVLSPNKCGNFPFICSNTCIWSIYYR